MKQINENINLNPSGIDRISELLDERMREEKIQEKNRIRTRLAIETILTNLMEHCPDEEDVAIITRRRPGAKAFIIRYDGAAYNPLQEEETDEWTDRFLTDIDVKPSWKYNKGRNEITLRVPRNKIRDEILLLAALVLAILLGFAGSVIPNDIQNTVMEYVMDPISTIFLSILKTFAGVLVFLSIVTGICGIGSLSEFSKVGKYLIGRYVFFTFIGAGFCILVMLPLHTLTFGATNGSAQGKQIFEMVLKIVPDNPITPFSEGNILQIVFLAVLVGSAILILLRESGELHAILIQMKNVVMHLLGILCYLLPIYIVASLTTLFWKNGMGIFRSIWKPLLLVVICLHLMAMVKVMIVSIRCKVSPLLLLKKAAASYLIGLTTASSMAALGTVLEASEKRFGVPKSLGEFGVPIGNVIGRHMVSGGFVIILFFLAEYAGVSISIGWLIGLWIYISIISFAMIPIAGGTLICLGIMLAQFGIPADLLAMGATLTLLADFVMAGTYVLDEHMEMVLQARHWGTLDEETLRKE